MPDDEATWLESTLIVCAWIACVLLLALIVRMALWP